MKPAERLGIIIARRRLKIPDQPKYVTILLGMPREITTSGDSFYSWGEFVAIPKGKWICPFKITGLPPIKHRELFRYNESFGIDAMQALLNALGGIEAILDRCVPALQWKYSYGLTPGFPIMLETFGLKNRLELKEKFQKEIGKNLKKPGLREWSPRERAMFQNWIQKEEISRGDECNDRRRGPISSMKTKSRK